MAATTPGAGGPDLLSLVASLDAALLPCLPARELQAADRSTHPSHQGKCSPECWSWCFCDASGSLWSFCFLVFEGFKLDALAALVLGIPHFRVSVIWIKMCMR